MIATKEENVIDKDLDNVLETFNPVYCSIAEIPIQMKKEVEELVAVGLIKTNEGGILIRKWELEGLVAGWKSLKQTFKK